MSLTLTKEVSLAKLMDETGEGEFFITTRDARYISRYAGRKKLKVTIQAVKFFHHSSEELVSGCVVTVKKRVSSDVT